MDAILVVIIRIEPRREWVVIAGTTGRPKGDRVVDGVDLPFGFTTVHGSAHPISLVEGMECT
jgi:hypothetical protein